MRFGSILEADSLGVLEPGRAARVGWNWTQHYCSSCYTGVYPVAVSTGRAHVSPARAEAGQRTGDQLTHARAPCLHRVGLLRVLEPGVTALASAVAAQPPVQEPAAPQAVSPSN